MFEGLGSRTYRYRYLIVAAWIVAAVLSFKLAPSLASSGATDQASFLPASAPSARANAAIEQAFPGSTSPSAATISFSRDTGLTDADRAYVAAFASWITSPAAPQVVREAVTSIDSATTRPELASMLRSGDGVVEMINVNLNVSSAGGEADAIVTALRDQIASPAASTAAAPAGLAVHVTGQAGISTDYLRAIKAGTDSTTTVTVLLVLVILLLIYRAPLAALVPLVTIGGAFVVARGVLGVLAAAGWQISSLLDTFLVVLVFGVGTDYAIFLISRYREEVRGGGDWHDASKTTVRRIGAVISASAATVMVGLGAMAFGNFEMIRSTGPALAIAIFVTLIAGLTLAPAMLSIFGHYLFWPLHDRPAPAGEPGGFFARLAAMVSRHPGVVTIALIAALLVPAAYLPQMKTNFDTIAELPSGSDARAGFDVVAAHMGKGKLVQSTGLIDAGASGDMLTPASLARLRDTAAALAAIPGIGTVTTLVTPDGDGVVPDGFRPSKQLATIGGAFAGDGSTSTSGSSSSLLDPKVSDGLASALDYLSALGASFPDVAGRSEYRAATTAITDAQDLVTKVKAQSVLSTQLRTLSAALTTPTSAASGGGTDSGLIADYLAELATAYPEVRTLSAFRDATIAADNLRRQASAGAAVDAANALNALAVHFDAQRDATLSPKSLANTPSALETKRQVTAAFDAIPGALNGLAAVFATRSDDIFVPVGLGGSDATKVQDAVDAFVSKDRTATRFYLTTRDDPYSTLAFAAARTAQGELDAAAPGFGQGAAASLGGATAQFADVQTVLTSDFNRVGVVTVLGILVVLMILLRAVVAPLYLVGTVLISYASAVGLSAWLFQVPLDQPGVSFYLPLMVFVLLVALGSDYNIFLMSRVREESEHRPIRDGIRIASGHTGAVITSAGLILAGTFGSMATAPLIVLFQVGVAVAIGVLIDTFVVRSILVPAITTLAGDRAWWPSGLRLGSLIPAPLVGDTIAAGTTAGERGRRSPARTAIAVTLALLVPLTFAGLITWARQSGGASITATAAVVDADDGATITAGDGTARTLQLGAGLAADLTAGRAGDAIAWVATDPATAADGLASGEYAAVLTIPAGFSRAVAAIRADTTGTQPAATLHLQTGDTGAGTTGEVAREVKAAIASSATRDVTASYVQDVLLAVSTTHADVASAAADARSVADRTSALASDASGVDTVAGELVSGLDKLAAGASDSVAGVTKLAAGTSALASGTKQVASGASSLATGASRAADGAARLSSGASSLASGLSALGAQVSGLPAQAAALATGASDLAAGASSVATGAASLSSGLATLKAQTTGLGAQVTSLDQGAADLASGASSVAGGATQAAGAATSLATGAGQLSSAVQGYTASVATLAAGCDSMGGGTAVCTALAGIAASNPSLTGAASDVASGAGQLSAATADLATRAAGVKAGATDLHAGTTQLAAAAPQLEAGIAQSAGGAASLATGAAGVAGGAASLASGTQQLAAGSTTLAAGVTSLSTGANGLASGAKQVAGGVADLSSGAAQLASGASKAASGASTLASGTASAAAGAGQLTDAVGQAADAGRIVQAETGRLAGDGSAIAGDASSMARSLDATAGSTPSYPSDAGAQVAGRVADPVAIEASGAATGFTGFTPWILALALWLGALAAFLVLPGRRRGDTWPLSRAAMSLAGAAALGLAGALLMAAGLRFGVGLEVASPAGFVLAAAVATLAFAAIVGALVALFGTRGWLLALLLAAVQVAASGYPYGVDALPGPLAFLHPLLPMSWAADALRIAVVGGTASMATDLVVLAGWLLVGVLVVLAVAAGAGRRSDEVAAAV